MRRGCSAAISSRDAISIGFRSFLLGEKSAARFEDIVSPLVIAGLDPAIPLRRAHSCIIYRDHRVRPLRVGPVMTKEGSHFSLLRVPVLLEIGDQRRREMAIGLLARVDRHVAAELVERLLRDTDGTAVAGCTDDARIR